MLVLTLEKNLKEGAKGMVEDVAFVRQGGSFPVVPCLTKQCAHIIINALHQRGTEIILSPHCPTISFLAMKKEP